MKNANGTAFEIALWSILPISLVIQILSVVYRWWYFDPRLSCERLTRWDDWLSCMHGHSHLYVIYAELAVGAWLVAGAAALLARMLPPYVSVTVPGGVLALCLWEMIRYWNEHEVPYAIIHNGFGVRNPALFFHFAAWTGFLAAYLVAPVAAAWLLGLSARKRRRLARQQKLSRGVTGF